MHALLSDTSDQSEVYNLKSLMGSHPGGDDILLSKAGTDATQDFEAWKALSRRKGGGYGRSWTRGTVPKRSIIIHHLMIRFVE